jgi:hypothetical protein
LTAGADADVAPPHGSAARALAGAPAAPPARSAIFALRRWLRRLMARCIFVMPWTGTGESGFIERNGLTYSFGCVSIDPPTAFFHLRAAFIPIGESGLMGANAAGFAGAAPPPSRILGFTE